MILSHNFIDPGTVTIVADTFSDTDNGAGGFTKSTGTIDYATGAINITLADSFVPTSGTPCKCFIFIFLFLAGGQGFRQ